MSAKFTRSSLGAPLAIGIMTVLFALPAAASSSAESDSTAESAELLDEEAADSEDASGSGAVQDSSAGGDIPAVLAKLQVHGFLTQAWAEADFVDGGPTANEIAIGIPERSTTNYRFLALQFRYEMTPKDTFVVQFSSRTLGDSPIQNFEDDIELDWAFYERRFTDSTSFKIGRILIPFGIYNEIRDVGTVLPFYRPPYNFYKEGTFTNETVDGGSLAHSFFPASDWNLDVTVYGGEWDSIQVPLGDPLNPQIDDIIDGYGYQVWLNTPLSELRIGTGLMSARQPGGSIPLEDPRRDIWTASLDGTFGLFTLRAEWQTNNFRIPLPFGVLDGGFTNWYVQTGFRVSDRIQIWGQLDVAEVDDDCLCYTRPADRTFREDLGVSLLYDFSPNILLKGEYHWTEEESSVLTPSAPGLFTPTVIKADGGTYTIISLSVSF